MGLFTQDPACMCCTWVKLQIAAVTLDAVSMLLKLVYESVALCWNVNTCMPGRRPNRGHVPQVLNSDGSVVTGINNAPQPKPLTRYNLNFQNSTTLQSMEYLTSNSSIGCSTCYDPPYLRGQNPATTPVPVCS